MVNQLYEVNRLNDEILTIEEVAKYLRVSDRTVYEWAQKGEIPAGKIGTVWRFKKDEIEKWVDDRLATSRKKKNEEPQISAKNILSPDRIVILDYSSKHDVLMKMSEVLAKAPQVKNSKELFKEIVKREELMSTAIGQGIAIPHVRLTSVTDLVMAVGVSKCDILDFDPVDSKPVNLVLMIAAAENQHTYYLHTISYFSGKLKDEDFKQKLFDAKDEMEIYTLLCED